MIFKVILNMYIYAYKLTSSYVCTYVVATVNLATIKYVCNYKNNAYVRTRFFDQQTVCFQQES